MEHEMNNAPEHHDGAPAPETHDTPQPAPVAPSNSPSTGSAIGIIIVVVVLVLGGFYFLSGKFGSDADTGVPPELGERQAPQQEADPLSEFEAMDDVDGDNDAELDAEFDSIDEEAQGSLETEIDLETQ